MTRKELRARLLKLVRERVPVKLDQEVTLASGKKSSRYFDGKQITLDGEGMDLMARLVCETVPVQSIDAVGGLTLGADPIASAVAVVAFRDHGKKLTAFIVRKDQKIHGLGKLIEGPALRKGSRVVVVDDVLTTGGSAKKAIAALEAAGHKVVGVVALLDRGEGARQALSAYSYTPLFEVSDVA